MIKAQLAGTIDRRLISLDNSRFTSSAASFDGFSGGTRWATTRSPVATNETGAKIQCKRAAILQRKFRIFRPPDR